jgi:hypothetical protein
MAQALSTELAEFMQSGVSVLVVSRDRQLTPACARAMGVRVERGRKALTVFVPEATGAKVMASLAASGRVAVCFARIEDHRSIQVKGDVVAVAPATDEERVLIERYRGEWSRNLAVIGMPLRLSLRQNAWPCHAVRVRVEALFVQTPGPGAGAPLAPPEPEAAR